MASHDVPRKDEEETMAKGGPPEQPHGCETPMCSFCRRRLPHRGASTWVLDERIAVDVPLPGSFYVVTKTSIGELTICSRCYESLPSYLTKDDQAKIHHEAGLVHCETDNFASAVECLEKSASLSRNDDVLATMGFAYSRLGETDKAIALYEEALRLNPDKLIARDNMRVLLSEKRLRRRVK